MKKELGFIGLGKMGKGLSEQLLEKGYSVFVWNRSKEPVEALVTKGAKEVKEVKDFSALLVSPRIIFVMLPSAVVPEYLTELLSVLSAGDIVIDGGNSFYKDSQERAKRFAEKGIHFLDAGISGGPSGARTGACIMVGGEKRVFDEVETLFKDISVSGGYLYVGASGAGHFTKMVHNGIEYGMMQAIGEGFEVLKRSEFNLSLEKIARLYNHGSVIESRLIGWLERAYQKSGENLAQVAGEVGHTGEGEWTVKTAKEEGVEVPVIENSYLFRVHSKGNPTYTGKVVSALRNQFGGHDVRETNN